MQEELVQECMDQNGCCARRSGAGKQKGILVTVRQSVGGCLSFRGFEMYVQRKTEARKDLHSRLRSENPAFLLKIADAYFSKPMPCFPGLKAIKTWRQGIFGKNWLV